ncbi:hypothetical protein SBADM41S_06254 [Streptomyces badius]
MLRRNARMIAGVALAPLGWLAYVVFVAVREGSPVAYFDVQAQWGNNIDGGRALAAFIAGLPRPAALGLARRSGCWGGWWSCAYGSGSRSPCSCTPSRSSSSR